jgi:hypothetical protein
MENMRALLGEMKVGGGKKSKKTVKTAKTTKTAKITKTAKTTKTTKTVKKGYRKVSKPRYFGGQELKCSCEPLNDIGTSQIIVQQSPYLQQAPDVQLIPNIQQSASAPKSTPASAPSSASASTPSSASASTPSSASASTPSSASAPSSASTPSSASAPSSVSKLAPSSMPISVGGGKMSVASYKKYLENLTTERLHKIASAKGVKITKKREGKTVYVKKATIVKKLCDFKHGR